MDRQTIQALLDEPIAPIVPAPEQPADRHERRRLGDRNYFLNSLHAIRATRLNFVPGPEESAAYFVRRAQWKAAGNGNGHNDFANCFRFHALEMLSEEDVAGKNTVVGDLADAMTHPCHHCKKPAPLAIFYACHDSAEPSFCSAFLKRICFACEKVSMLAGREADVDFFAHLTMKDDVDVDAFMDAVWDEAWVDDDEAPPVPLRK